MTIESIIKNFSCAVAATSVLLCTSCVKSVLSPDADRASDQIKFCLIPVKTQTKAVTVSKFPEDGTFGTRAWYLAPGKTWTKDASSAVSYVGQEEISCQESVWKAWTSGNVYWWPQTGTLTFYSWSPYNLVDKGLFLSQTTGFSIDEWSMANTVGYGCSTDANGDKIDDGCVDILFAKTTDCSKLATGAPVRFIHQLSKVRVIATLAKERTEPETTWKIKSVTISDVYTKGSFVTDHWIGRSENKDYVYEPATEPEVDYGNNTVIFPETMMMPQLMTEDGRSERPRITVVCTDGTGTEKTLAARLYNNTATGISAWQIGKYITYLITIGDEDSYIEFDATAGDWSYDEDGIIDVGIVD